MNIIENAILKAKVNGELKQIFFNTGVDNIIITEDGNDITLTQKLAEIITSLGEVTTSLDEVTTSLDDVTTSLDEVVTLDAVETKISDAIADVVDSAPESLNTLRELAEAITENSEVMDTLNEVIGNKVSTEEGKELVSTALVDTLSTLDFDVLASLTAEKLASLEQGGEDNVIETINVNGTPLEVTDKAVSLSVPTITVSADEPISMNEGDLFLQII